MERHYWKLGINFVTIARFVACVKSTIRKNTEKMTLSLHNTLCYCIHPDGMWNNWFEKLDYELEKLDYDPSGC
jgi:hypothetical protein